MNKNNKGFTLIELLIVIVLIGILAAVLVTVINPSKQQNAANDGTITAMMNKLILSTESFNSAYGRVPNDEQFFGSLELTVNEFNSTCTGGLDSVCLFAVDGINMPSLCDANGWTDAIGDSTSQCYFRYSGNISGTPGRFRLYAKSSGAATSVFTFDNLEGGEVYECPLDIDDADSLVARCY